MSLALSIISPSSLQSLFFSSERNQTVYFLFTSFLSRLIPRRPLLMYAVSWTGLLMLTVAVASFLPEVAFVTAITPSSSFSKECWQEGLVRVLADVPMEIVCLPNTLFRKSRIDFLVPPIFAALVVSGSACVVRALGLWEDNDSH